MEQNTVFLISHSHIS